MTEKIEVIDIIHHYSKYSDEPQIFVVLNRAPQFAYEQNGNLLAAHDSGFHDFLCVRPRSHGAFGGRKFDLNMTDGSKFHCHGQVWACGVPTEMGYDEMIYVGFATIEGLKECYVFSSGKMTRSLYDDWMKTNQPSHNYHKYNPEWTIEYLDDLQRKYPNCSRIVSKKRARKLKKRGVTIHQNSATGMLGWSPYYEHRKAKILERLKPDFGVPEHLK